MNKAILLFTIFSILGFTSATHIQTNIKNNLVELGIPLEKYETTESNQLINIAFFGVDRHSTSDFGNSDLIMIISIDPETRKVKLSSIMRDTYVKIYARGQNKINAAYFEGGPQLAIRTLNENFDLAIKEYISVDFFGSAKIIQALGGLEIDVKPEEIEFLNNYLGEIAGIEGTKANYITKPGIQLLDGKQCVSYSRIRAVGRGDYGRIERQKTVMNALASKFNMGKQELLSIIIRDVLPNIETNLEYSQLYHLGTQLMSSGTKSFEHARFPLDDHSSGIRIDSVWYLSADIKATTNSLHNFIYKDIKP